MLGAAQSGEDRHEMIQRGLTGAKPPESGRTGDRQAPAIESGTLFAGTREVIILHRGERYRLRVTQSDKLILTK